MFIVVAINIFAYLLIPQYAIYGDQKHTVKTDVSCMPMVNSNELSIFDEQNGTSIVTKPCTQFDSTGNSQRSIELVERFV
jgi:hypothetical protein